MPFYFILCHLATPEKAVLEVKSLFFIFFACSPFMQIHFLSVDKMWTLSTHYTLHTKEENMYTSINIFILLLSLTWSFLRLTKLHFVVLTQLLLTAFDVEPYRYEKIMLTIGIIWLIVVIKPLFVIISSLKKK